MKTELEKKWKEHAVSEESVEVIAAELVDLLATKEISFTDAKWALSKAEILLGEKIIK